MFGYCTHLNNLDLSNFDVSKVTDIDRLFIGCSNLTSVCLPSNIKITIDFPTKINGVNYHWKDENGIVRETAVQNLSTPMTYTRYNGKAPSKTDTTTTPAKPTTPSTPAPTEPQKISVTSITLTGASKKIAAGKSIQLTANVFPENATNKAVTWTSSNTKYVTVSETGKVTVKKNAAGKSVIIKATAADGSGASASYTIKVNKDSVKKITLSAASKTVKAGKSLKAKATVTTTGSSANKTLTWTSSNPKYATVSKSGKVKTTKAGKGKTVTITAASTDGSNKKAKIKIKIK